MSKKLLIAVFILITILHLTYIPNGFIWLDHNDIEQGFAVLPLSKLYEAFSLSFGQTSFYRPIVVIVNSIDYALYHSWAPGFHITNIILHLLVTYVSLRFILRFWKIDQKLVPLLVLFLGTHPVTIFISGAINQRQESLLLLFILLTIYFVGKPFSLLFWGLALFTKETALVVAPLLMLIVKGFSASEINNFVKKNWLLASGYPIILTFYLYFRNLAVPHLWGTSYPNLTVSENIGTRLWLLGKMTLNLLSPLKPNLSDATLILGISSPYVLVIIFVVGGTVFLIIRKKVNKVLLKALLMLIILLLPGLNLIPVPRIASPHYSYLALPAICTLVFLFIQIQKKLLKKFSLAILTTWLIISSYITFTSGKLFKDDVTLFSYETSKEPNFVEAYYYLGNYYLKNGDFQKALDSYNKTEGLRPNVLFFKDSVSINFNRATTLMQLGKHDEALRLLKEVESKANDKLKPYVVFNEALIYYQMEEFDKVVELLEGKDWEIIDAYLLLSKAYEMGKQEDP